jgi:hypothetical protein
VKRRLFLKGAAGAALAAPFLPSLLPRKAFGATATGPQRLVIFYTQNGCLTNRWFPKTEAGPSTPPRWRDRRCSRSAISPGSCCSRAGSRCSRKGTINGYFDPHDQGMGSKLTAAPIKPDTDPLLDGTVARLAGRLDVQPGTKSPLVLSVGSSFANVKGILSYKPGATAADLPTPYTPEVNAKNVYSSLTGLFQGGTVTPADYMAMQGKSILDICRGDIDTLAGQGLSQADTTALVQWKDLMRDAETKVVTTAACTADNATALGITSRRDGRGRPRPRHRLHEGRRHDDQPDRADDDVRRQPHDHPAVAGLRDVQQHPDHDARRHDGHDGAHVRSPRPVAPQRQRRGRRHRAPRTSSTTSRRSTASTPASTRSWST